MDSANQCHGACTETQEHNRVADRPGEPHQMVHVLAAESLVYLCISTMRGAEIVEYPDSGNVGASVTDPNKPGRLPPHSHVSLRQWHARLLGERARRRLSLVQLGHSPGEGAGRPVLNDEMRVQFRTSLDIARMALREQVKDPGASLA
jgi:hypothetical protein